ncbi:DUF1906 domain-containing protein [Streptomyces armeniacus]|uniref:DUF1906 domain-containing protein n=1 Tax=Streptomyces armeniacus TaxID=83291 RepID=A0A345XYW0_9ACTN|nr:glycoside hydrolase domain-containing protein [Streptomyces armeniacus]AXK36826.1 DUF1906 domain-containing protein [Streptomyces armeniacus]
MVRRTIVWVAALASLLAGLFTGTGTSATAAGADRPDPQPSLLPAPAEPSAYPQGAEAEPEPGLTEPGSADAADATDGAQGDDPDAEIDPSEINPSDAVDTNAANNPTASGARVFQGEGFDTCLTPPLDTMRAWTASPYRAVGVYIGGRGRACPNQPNLDRDWVRGVTGLGWRLLPLYVGSQSPCVHSERKRRYAIDAGRAWQQGVREGRDAVARARELGMAANSAIYLDMEAYDQRDAKCGRTTLKFVRGWNREVRRLDYVPGFYSSAISGISHLERVRSAGERDLPAAIWFARWRVGPNLHGEPALAPGAWQPHRRIHQYEGNVKQTFGGRTLQIDKNVVDAPVAVVR